MTLLHSILPLLLTRVGIQQYKENQTLRLRSEIADCEARIRVCKWHRYVMGTMAEGCLCSFTLECLEEMSDDERLTEHRAGRQLEKARGKLRKLQML